MRFRIAGGRVLTADGFETIDLAVAGSLIAATAEGQARTIDASNLLVLPGIVDVHGDAFERQIQPRPGVAFPIPLALAETERQLLGNGITTAFHAATLSWEPGLRSAATWRGLLDALGSRAWDCDMRAHMRWEACNFAAMEMAEADIAAGRVAMVSFNDHTPAILRALDNPAAARKYSERAQISPAAFRAVADSVATEMDRAEESVARIGAAARAAKLPMASHDDATVAVRENFRARGAAICEFPMAEEVGLAARAAGEAVVMGAPNVVRGGSHLGWASAARLAVAGVCDVLCSDYFYPAMLAAPFALAAEKKLDLAAAWRLVSTNPARAAGLADRGVIENGRRADLLLVSAADVEPRLLAVIAAGRLVWMDSALAHRLG